MVFIDAGSSYRNHVAGLHTTSLTSGDAPHIARIRIETPVKFVCYPFFGTGDRGGVFLVYVRFRGERLDGARHGCSR